MVNKEMVNKEYKEISIIDYLVTLKKNRGIIFLITLIVAVGGLILSLESIKQVYEGDMVISIGNIKGGAFESGDQVASDIAHFDSDATVTQEEGGKILSIVMKKPAREDVANEMRMLNDFLLARNADMVKKKLDPLDQHITFLKEELKKEGDRLNQLQITINRLNPLEYAQALSLQAYMQSYDSALRRKIDLENNLQSADADRANFQETSIQKSDVNVTSPLGKILRNTIIAIIIGFILATLCAFIKEWWKVNKVLMK